MRKLLFVGLLATAFVAPGLAPTSLMNVDVAYAKKMKKGELDFNDLAEQLAQMRKMGGMQGLLGMLPGVGKIKEQLAGAKVDESLLKRQEAIISSMTPAERRDHVYETLERPMVATLAAMERRGVMIDRAILSRLSGEFAQDMARLEADIVEMAGESFNLASPKQLGDILFGKMGLPGAKKTATGAWSTSASVLEDLAVEGNDFARRILDWRQLAKLKSTYVDGFELGKGKNIWPDGKMHCSFNTTFAETGRTSADSPNQQNWPKRFDAWRNLSENTANPGSSPGWKGPGVSGPTRRNCHRISKTTSASGACLSVG